MRILTEHKLWWACLYVLAVAMAAMSYIRTGAPNPGGLLWDIVTIVLTGMLVLLLCAALAGILAVLAWPVRRRFPSSEGFLGITTFIIMFIGLSYTMVAIDRTSQNSDGQRVTEEQAAGIWEAIDRRDLEATGRFLDEGASPDQRDANGNTLLVHAAASGDADLAELLLRHGADPDAVGLFDTVPLAEAASRGHRQLVSLLLSFGASPNSQGAMGATPLYLAVAEGHVEVSELLIMGGADPQISDVNGISPLMIAEHFGDSALLNVLR